MNFLLVYTGAAAVILGMGLYAFASRSGPSARVFGILTLLEFSWAILLLLEIGYPGTDIKILMDNLQFVVMFALGPVFLHFCLLHSDLLSSWRYRILAMVSLPSLIFNILLFSPGREWLFRIDPVVRTYPFGMELFYSYGILSRLSIFWSLVLVLAGIGFLLYRVIRPGVHSRFISLWVIIGFLLPAALLGMGLIVPRPEGTLRDVSPLMFALSNLLLAPVLFRYRLLDALPEIRSDITRDLEEGVVVSDLQGRIIDVNRAAEFFFRQNFGLSPVGSRLAQYFPAIGPLIGHSGEIEEEIPAAVPRIVRIHVSPVFRAGEPHGAVAVFHDMTRCRMNERELDQVRSSLEALVRKRTRDLNREIESRTRAEEQLALLNEDLVISRKEILLTLGELLERRSVETARHVQRVAEVARILAREMGLEEDICRRIYDAAPLHDVGKVVIPDSILHKPGPLTPSEWGVMQTHAEAGYCILNRSSREPFATAAVIARSHHEQWNGEGYPLKLKGEEIPLEGRIVALADVFDALGTRRFYGDPWSESRIVEYILSGSSTRFDPRVAEAFSRAADECFSFMTRFPDLPERNQDSPDKSPIKGSAVR